MSAYKAFEDEIKSLSSFSNVTLIDGPLYDSRHEFDDDEQLFDEFDDDLFGSSNDKIDFKNPCPKELPFKDFRKDMKRVNHQVYKTVLKAGVAGPGIDLEQFEVTYDYSMFLENSVAPLESSIQNKKRGFITSDQEALPGVLMAVATMKKGETSLFWISYELMFGRQGCFPRVPHSADVLFHVTITNVKKMKKLTLDDKPHFIKLIKSTLKEYVTARSHFNKGNVHGCIAIYQKLIKQLENARLTCEADELKQKQFLIKIYQNISVCYNKVNSPERSCLMLRELEKLISIQTNPKALCAKAKANMLLLNYTKSRKFFTMAHALVPADINIAAEINEVNRLEREVIAYEGQVAEASKQSQIQEVEQKEAARLKAEKNEEQNIRFKKELESLVAQFKSYENLENIGMDPQISNVSQLVMAEKICKIHGVYLIGIPLSNCTNLHYHISKKPNFS